MNSKLLVLFLTAITLSCASLSASARVINGNWPGSTISFDGSSVVITGSLANDVTCLDVWGWRQGANCVKPTGSGSVKFTLTRDEISAITADPVGTGFTPRQGADAWLPIPLCPANSNSASPVLASGIMGGVTLGKGVQAVCVDGGGKYTFGQ